MSHATDLVSAQAGRTEPPLAPVPSARRCWTHLADAVPARLAGLSRARRDELCALLIEDVISEYDARFLSAHLRGLELELTPTFRRVEAAWASDEERHFAGFRDVFAAGWGDDCAWLAERTPDFEPLAHLFEDEFTILVLFAYDELATVRAYRANLPRYEPLGPEPCAFVRAVIADEAWHYARFFRTAVREHPERLAGASEVVARVRASEGVAYAATFVLDHDDPVFTDRLYDEVAALLERRFARAALDSARGLPPAPGRESGAQGEL